MKDSKNSPIVNTTAPKTAGSILKYTFIKPNNTIRDKITAKRFKPLALAITGVDLFFIIIPQYVSLKALAKGKAAKASITFWAKRVISWETAIKLCKTKYPIGDKANTTIITEVSIPKERLNILIFFMFSLLL